MSRDKIIMFKRGPSDSRETFTPVAGEIILDTTTNELYVGDGYTPGGILIKNSEYVAKKVLDEELRIRLSNHHIKFLMDNWEELI